MSVSGGLTAANVRSGVLWIAGLSVLRDALQFGSTLILVRLVDAKAYGELSLINAITGVLLVISFRSFVEFTLQSRPGEVVDYQAQWTFGAWTQGAAFLILNTIAIFGSTIAIPLSVMSLVFPLEWASELRVKMLERELNWGRLRLLEGAGLLMQATLAVLLAWRGAGIYALIVPLLVTPLPFIWDLFFVAEWRPTWEFNWNAFQPAWRYGLTRMASGLVARGQELLETTAMASWIGLAALGVYGRAAGLASFCCLKFGSLLSLTIFPMLTRLEPGSSDFRRASAVLLRAIAWTSIPIAAFCAALAGPLVRLLFGARWPGVVPLLPWALAIAACLSLVEASAFLLLTNLQPRKTLAIDAMHLAGTAISLTLLPQGVIPYMQAMLILHVLLLAVAVMWLFRSEAIELSGIATALTIPAGTVAVLGLLALVTPVKPQWLFGCGLPLLYVPTLRVFAAPELRELTRLLFQPRH